MILNWCFIINDRMYEEIMVFIYFVINYEMLV